MGVGVWLSLFFPPTTFLWKRLDVDLQVTDELLVTQLELILIIKATERLRFSRALVIRLVRAPFVTALPADENLAT